MLDIILRILPILGIIFLTVLALLVLSLLLVLFFPIAYRFSASRDVGDLKAAVKLTWLFGLLRIRYQYPEPGHVTAKVLCFTLYDSKFPVPEEEAAGKSEESGHSEVSTEERMDEAAAERTESEVVQDGCLEETMAEEGQAQSAGTEDSDVGHSWKFFQKIEKIKYTIRGICDKIKEIWENISYYIELLQEEDTKQLFSALWFRMGVVLKSIRPRHIKADILFGTGSPDTTGYIYGLYCMLSSFLGYNRMWVTPDFENAVLKGEIEISGHITLWVLLVNGVKLIFDKRLKKMIRKIKAGKKE